MDADNHLYVDGPTNAIRLEGEVDGIKKSVYLFADYHADVKVQTKCSTFDSIPISNFIYKKMSDLKNGLKYDLFGEMTANQFLDPSIDSHLNNRYIENYMMMLRTIQYQKSSAGKFENVRVHYADPRDYLFSEIDRLIWEMFYMISNNSPNKKIIDLINIIQFIITLHQSIILMIRTPVMEETIIKIKNAITKNAKKQMGRMKKRLTAYDYTESQMDTFITEYSDYLIKINDMEGLKRLLSTILFFNKLLNRFNQESVKDLIVNKLCFYIIDQMDNLLDRLHDFKKIVEKKDKKMESVLVGIYNSSIQTYAVLMDVYFMKRLLDKSYIERAILYSGGAHSSRIIYCLVRYMGFKITHMAHNHKKMEFNQISKKIKNDKLEKMDDIMDYFVNKDLVQCTDIYDFPIEFT